MAGKRIISLLTGTILAVLMALPSFAQGVDFSLYAVHEYLGLGTSDASAPATTDVETVLKQYIKTDHNGYRYNLLEMGVVGLNGRMFSGAEILAGATFTFVDIDYVLYPIYDNPRLLSNIIVQTSGNGVATADVSTAAVGDTVTLSARPHSGYKFARWTVLAGGIAPADADAANTTFSMPAAPVRIQAEFEQTSTRGSGGSGSNADSMGYISVIGIPKEPVDVESDFTLTTIPIDTQVEYDRDALSMVENKDGSRTFTALKPGKATILFRKARYYDRPVEIPVAAAVDNAAEEASEDTQDDLGAATPPDNHNPGTGAPPAFPAMALAGLGCLVAAAALERRG